MAIFRTLPSEPPAVSPGVYLVKIVAAKDRVSANGNPMLVMRLSLPGKGELPCTITFVEAARRLVNAFSDSAQLIKPDSPDVEVELNASLCSGRWLYVVVSADPNEPQPINGDALLTELASIAQKHVVTDDHCRVAIALWSVLAFLVDLVDAMPILAIVSPEKRCGKSRLLSLLLRLVRRPIIGVSLTAATIYRAIEKWHPSLLIDEADGMLRDNRGHDNLELRNVINSSHLRDRAFTLRCVGENHDPQRFSTWAPKAIALIGKMPDSMMDRAIPIPMKRKTKAETVARIQDTSPQVFAELRSKIVRFVQDYGEKIAVHKPVLPAGLNDRAEDCWSPLLAIADIAGGNWPDLAFDPGKDGAS